MPPPPRLHIDCATGVAGDMLLAALLHAGLPLDTLTSGLSALGLDHAFDLEPQTRTVAGIVTTHLRVIPTSSEPLRRYRDIAAIIESAGLPGPVKEGALETLTTLGRAEAAVHGIPLEEVHFHEIGAVDTIVDIVGAHILVHRLGPSRITASPVNLGSGFVTMAHGTHPVPAPAVAELSRGMAVFATDLGREAATPTGMAIVKSLAAEFTHLQPGTPTAVGYGSGTLSGDDFPTYVRAFVMDELCREG